jgi:yeast amino acid transporter
MVSLPLLHVRIIRELTGHRAYNGHSVDEIPYKATMGVTGSWICLFINVIALIASFYVSLYPVGGPYLNAENFFINFLAGPLLIFLWAVWKVYSWFYYPSHRALYIRTKDIDIYSGMRESQRELISGQNVSEDQRRASIAEMQDEDKANKTMKGRIVGAVRNII